MESSYAEIELAKAMEWASGKCGTCLHEKETWSDFDGSRIFSKYCALKVQRKACCWAPAWRNLAFQYSHEEEQKRLAAVRELTKIAVDPMARLHDIEKTVQALAAVWPEAVEGVR